MSAAFIASICSFLLVTSDCRYIAHAKLPNLEPPQPSTLSSNTHQTPNTAPCGQNVHAYLIHGKQWPKSYRIYDHFIAKY
jgi:hypothetical protein